MSAHEFAEEMNLIYIDPRNIQITDTLDNPREDYGDLDDLANDIHKNGLSIPVKVSIGEVVDGVQKYNLEHGFRRTSAMQVIIDEHPEWDAKVPVLIVKYTKEQSLVAHLTDNSGKPLNPLEQAEIFRRLHKEHGHSMQDTATMCGVSYSSVSQLMKLAEAPAEIKDLIRNDCISPSLATRIILENTVGGKPDYQGILETLNQILNGKLASSNGSKKGKITKADLAESKLAKVSKLGSKIQKEIKKMTADQVQDEMVQNANAFLNLVEKLNSLEGEELQEFLCSWQLVPKEEIEI
jgi:ParB/RepB/Spo0J family partition protein